MAMNVLEHLLRAEPPQAAIVDLDAWFERLTRCPFELPIDRALWSGFEADRLGYAFVGGYQAALARLFMRKSAKLGTTTVRRYEWPERGARLSLAATEANGAHPRSIQTALIEESGTLVVRGEKTFATLASVADEILVVATRGKDLDGKSLLALVRVRKDAPGVTIEERAPTPFAPEIPHARVTLDDVAITTDDILPGDGYTTYLKPLRTIEDLHVLAATLAHVIATARAHAFAPAVAEGALALAVAAQALAACSPAAPVGHVALAGLYDAASRLVTDHAGEWTKAPAPIRERWARDQPLLHVMSQARQQRTAAAWLALTRPE